MIKLVLMLIVANVSTHATSHISIESYGYATCDDVNKEINNKQSDIINELKYNKLVLMHVSCE